MTDESGHVDDPDVPVDEPPVDASSDEAREAATARAEVLAALRDSNNSWLARRRERGQS